MSEKGPFDAAISLFQEAVKQTRLGDFDTDHFIAEKHGLYRLGLISQAELAIHFLEAAGKVNKDKLMDYLDHVIDWKENDSYGPGSAKEDRQLRALLESLPDKEKK